MAGASLLLVVLALCVAGSYATITNATITISSYQPRNWQWELRLFPTNDVVIENSKVFTSKTAAEREVNSAIEHSTGRRNFERLTSRNGRHYYFDLTDDSAKVVGTSKMYDTTKERDDAIDAVRKWLSKANIVYEMARVGK